jgi:GR25 family glycosyltransferase involved in LPS biosynthesis
MMQDMEIEFIVMTTAFGNRDISEMKRAIPNLQLCVDYNHDAMVNFLNSMRMTDKPAVHLEDDAILCDDFVSKITRAIELYPDNIINFFSLRKKDYEVRKPFFELGSKYIGNVCFYVPATYGNRIADFYNVWDKKEIHPTGYDILMADWMKLNKLKYVQWFPHLVNHAEGKSIINPKRSSKRIDTRFRK